MATGSAAASSLIDVTLSSGRSPARTSSTPMAVPTALPTCGCWRFAVVSHCLGLHGVLRPWCGLRSRVWKRTNHQLRSRGHPFELRQQVRRLLELSQHCEVGPYLRPHQLSALLEDDALDVDPILRPRGERFVHNEILGRARPERRAAYQFHVRGSLDGAGFEGHRAERDINSKSIGGPQQQHTIAEGKLLRSADTTFELGKERRDVRGLAAKPRQQRQSRSFVRRGVPHRKFATPPMKQNVQL